MKTLLLSLGILFSILTNAATFTSTMNGDWASPFTWGETTTIPLTGDEVIINHTVTITDAITVNGYWSTDGANASITIGNNGILQTGTDILGIAILNGAIITNNGQLNMPQLGNYQGSFINNGTANFYSLIYNLDNIENYGGIQEVDSFYTSGVVNSYNGSQIDADSLRNDGVFVNAGDLTPTYFYNSGQFTNDFGISCYDVTNSGTFTNNYAILVQNDAINLGTFTNAAGAHINLTRNFSNVDSINHTALFINDGLFNIGNSWTNIDTTRGSSPGQINIEEDTYNSGFMKGDFMFCDNTLSVSVAPFIDYNTGVIAGTVRYCTDVAVNEFQNTELSFYPNPANHILNISSADKIIITDITGKQVHNADTRNQSQIDISQLNKGIYFISLIKNQNTTVRKLVIE